MIKVCNICGGLYATENMESFAGTPCSCVPPREHQMTITPSPSDICANCGHSRDKHTIRGNLCGLIGCPCQQFQPQLTSQPPIKVSDYCKCGHSYGAHCAETDVCTECKSCTKFQPSTQQGECKYCVVNGQVNCPEHGSTPQGKEGMKTGIELIAEERQRQMEIENWTSAHDDKHKYRELASAAFCYVEHYVGRAHVFKNELGLPGVSDGEKAYRKEPAPWKWPWGKKWWKPKDPMRDLIRAGALIAAEIDRLQRKAQ